MEMAEMSKHSTLTLNVLVHGVALALFLALNDITMHAYKEMYGDFNSRGIAPGILARIELYLFAVTNIAAALITKINFKLLTVAAFALATIYFALPSHPLRFLFYCLSGSTITLISIYASKSLQNTIKRDFLKL